MAQRILVRLGNVYVGNRTPLKAVRRLLRKPKPDAVIINEGRKVVGLLGKFRGYRGHVSPYGSRRGRTDVLVLVRRKHKFLGMLVLEISKNLPKFAKVGHQRFLVVAMFHVKGFGPVAVVGFHPTPGPKALAGNDPNHPIVKQFQRAMDSVAAVVKFLEDQGFYVVVGADVQVRPGSAADTKPWSPSRMLTRVGQRVVVWAHLDFLSGPSGSKGTGKVIDPPGVGTGADHPFVESTFSK